MARKYLGTGLEGIADVGVATGIGARHLAATVEAVQTSGYSAAGKGAGTYVSDALANAALAAAHPRFCKQSADGRYWRLLPEPWIAVTQGGAAGDGTSDDFAAIQAAIDYGLSFGGATIYFPAATYKVDSSPQIASAKGLNLLGEGPDRSIISGGAMPAMKTLGYWRSSVEGIQFQCNANTTGGAFELEGKPDGSFGVQQIQFRNCMFFGNYNSKYVFTNQRIATGSGQGSECSWIGCAFQGAGHASGDALFMQNGSNALNNTITGCNFQGFLTGVLIYAGNVDILHTGFQSTYGYEQISDDGWDVDASYSSVGDRATMTGCRSESLRIYRGGGNFANISAFTQQQGAAGDWGTGAKALNSLVRGRTTAGNDKLYRVSTAGTSGGAQPTWPESGTVADGTAVWTQLEFNVFERVQGTIARGQMQLGQFGVAFETYIEDVFVTRDDCFGPSQFISDERGPHIRDLRLGGAPPPGSASRPIKIGNNANAGARNTDPNMTNFGNHALVWTEGNGGGTFHDITLARGGGDYNYKAGNWFQMVGGFAPGQLAFAELAGATVANGVLFFVTDGTPGSGPLTGGGTGCLAVRQNGAWKAVDYSAEDAQDAVGAMAGASLVYTDASPLLARAALTGAIIAAQDSNVTALGSFTLAQLNTALSDADVATGGGTATGANTGDQISVSGNAGTATALATSRNFSLSGGGITAAAVGFTGAANVVLSASVDAGHVTLARMADIAAARFIGRTTAGTGAPEALTGTQATALLDVFTAGLKGLAPASGGGTANFLRADGAWAAPGGGGSAAGNSGELQYNNGGTFAGAANVEVDGGNLKLVSTTDPAAPTAGITLYSKSIAGRHLPKIIGPSGIDTVLQVGLHGNAVFFTSVTSGTTAPDTIGGTLTTAATMSMQQTIASANPWQATQRKRFASTATAGSGTGMRTAYVQWFRGNAAGFGGFFFRAQLGQNLNVNGAQCFHGLCVSTAVLGTAAGSVAALLNMIGMGYDTTDSSAGNWQLYRNDGAGTATKVDLGANAARNTTHGFDLIVYCPPGAASEIFVRVVNIHTGTVVLDTSYTTDLPAVNTGMAFKAECNNGAVASAQNLEVAKVYIESDY